MSVSDKIDFCGYKISAITKPHAYVGCAASFIVEKDGEIIFASEAITFRLIRTDAVSIALLRGIQYVDLVLMKDAETVALCLSNLPFTH